MTPNPLSVLIVGSTGSIGTNVVAEAVRAGHRTRALVRKPRRARNLYSAAEIVVGELTRPDTLTAAVDGIDAVVFTHGSNDGEGVNYGAVKNVFAALGEKYGKSAAQVMLRWHIQEGRQVIPKSTKPERIAENIDVFDFALTPAELADTDALENFGRNIPEA